MENYNLNPPEAKVYTHCDECRGEIQDFEDLFKINNYVYCEECIERFREEPSAREELEYAEWV
jgi:hypothetical protein